MLRSRTTAALIGLTVLAACGEGSDATAVAPALAANVQPLKAGLYSIVQTGDAAGEDERCIDAADIAARRFASADSIPEGWTVETNRMSGGAIEVSARHEAGRMSIVGSYKPETFMADAAMDVKVNGKDYSTRSSIKGTFISPDCPEME